MPRNKEAFEKAEKALEEMSKKKIPLGGRSDKEILSNAGNLGVIWETDLDNRIQILQLEVLLDIRKLLNKDYDLVEQE